MGVAGAAGSAGITARPRGAAPCSPRPVFSPFGAPAAAPGSSSGRGVAVVVAALLVVVDAAVALVVGVVSVSPGLHAVSSRVPASRASAPCGFRAGTVTSVCLLGTLYCESYCYRGEMCHMAGGGAWAALYLK